LGKFPNSRRDPEKLPRTGRPGSGKTTVIKRVTEGLGERALGFYTQEIREKEGRKGFEIITTWGGKGNPGPYVH
jgi:nucleoside-triphosphatase